MVPPWTPEPPAGDAPAGAPDGDPAPAEPEASPPQGPVPAAPPRRFLGVRRALGRFARTGDREALRHSLGHYVRTGYGGSGTTTRRFGGTARTAAALGDALATIAGLQPAPPGSPLDPVLLAGRSAQEIMDAVAEAVRPVDGTLDAEASRAATREALTDVLTRFPEADLLVLDAEQRAFAIERYAAFDVFRRYELDVGPVILEKAPDAATALGRLKEARDYVAQCVAASFRRLREAGRAFTSGRIGQLVRDALKETFEVFEGYIE